MLHQIGAGALGPVFRAYEPDQDKLVAVKLFQLDLPPDRTHRLVAAIEPLIEADLTHPAIAAPIATGIAGTSAYLAQDFVSAESLDILIRNFGAAAPADAARIATQLAGALDFAAVVGILHGALHPRDVLLSPDDARLTGLGIAQALERVTVPVPIRRPYTAPERVAGRPWDRRADVFSLAALIHELLWARRVTAIGDEAADALTEIEGGNLPALRQVFARALAQDPSQRFDTALAFAEELTRAAITPRTAASNRAPRVVAEAPRVVEPPPRAEQVRHTPEHELRLPLDEPDIPLQARPPGAKSIAPPAESVQIAADPIPIAAVPSSLDIDPPHAGRPDQADLTLRAAESGRYQDVESTAAAPAPQPSGSDVLAADSRRPADAGERSDTSLQLERFLRDSDLAAAKPRGVKPLTAALAAMFILAFGFIIGRYTDVWRPLAPVSDPADPGPDASGSSVATSGTPSREFTETAVGDRAPATAAPKNVAPAGVPSTAAPATAAPPREAAPPAAPTSAAPSSAGQRSTRTPASAPRGASRNAVPSAPARPDRAAPPTPSRRTDAAAAAADGRLLVRSTPAGARVMLDGREVGLTPLALRDLPVEAHTLRVVRAGYLTQERRVVLSAREPSQSVTFEMSRSTTPLDAGGADARPATPSTPGRFSGALEVESRPAGARVFLDGKLLGMTPLTVPNVAAGAHAIRLERDGYSRWTASIRIVAGERNRVTASMER